MVILFVEITIEISRGGEVDRRDSVAPISDILQLETGHMNHRYCSNILSS